MAKITVTKVIGSFRIVPSIKHGYKNAEVDVQIGDGVAVLTVREGYNDATIISWYLKTDDGIKREQKDFSAFDAFGMLVDTTEVTQAAIEFFKTERIKQEEIEKQKKRDERATTYSTNMLATLKPLLESKGYTVAVATTKEEYMDGKDIDLVVNGEVHIYRDYRGWFCAIWRYNGERFEKTTKSSKAEKMVETVKQMLNLIAQKKEKAIKIEKKGQMEKEILSEMLGVEVVAKVDRQWVRDPYNKRGAEGTYRNSTYYVRKVDAENEDAIRFTAITEGYGEKEKVKGFKLSNLPVITDAEKLKKLTEIYDDKKEE